MATKSAETTKVTNHFVSCAPYVANPSQYLTRAIRRFAWEGVKWLFSAVLVWGFPRALPAIDLKSDFESLQLREYYIRVGIVHDASELRVAPRDDFYICDRMGQVLYSGTGKVSLRFACRDTQAAKPVFYHLLATYDPDRRDEAERFARRAAECLDRKVNVIDDPRQPLAPSPSGEPPPPPHLVAAVGPYTSRDAARRDAKLVNAQYKAEFFETVDSPAQGWVEARDDGGKVVARAQTYLGIRSKQRDALIEASPTAAAAKSSASRKRPRAYRGLMEAWVNPSGRLSLVNRVFLEHYLYGVVPPEIGHSNHFEVKKVQAVISRTVAIAKLRSRPHAGWPFDVCDEQHCQVYLGADAETSEARRAVDATWGQVCTYGNDVIKAVYSQCCGGRTANCQDVWEGDPVPYLQSRYDSAAGLPRSDLSVASEAERWIASSPDTFCNPRQGSTPNYANGRFRWTRRMSASQIAESLRKAGYGLIDHVTDIRVIRRGKSGHVLEVEILTDSRRPFRVRHDVHLRQALGNLPSSSFVLERAYDSEKHLTRVTFKGAGSGHGVGLCQIGAMRMADLGYTYIDILKHYYSGIDIYRIYR